MQEVMLRVVEQSRKQEIDNPLAYAYRVADSMIYAQARKFSPKSDPIDDQLECDRPWADEILQHKERVLIFENALKTLTPLQRDILLRRHLDGLSRQDIARQLGMNVEAVKKHLVRAMAEMARAAEASRGTEGGAPGHDR